MTEIDFLPSQYREQHTHRKNQAWRVVVVVAFACLGAAGMYAQRAQRQKLEDQLDSTRLQYNHVLRQMEELYKLDAQLADLRAQATLINYLRNPWPRTRILCAVLEPVPETISLTDVQIHYVTGERNGFVRERPIVRERRSDEAPELHPALADLNQFRREGDQQQCVVSISGSADEHVHLHHYLDDISHHELVRRVELLDVEAADLHGSDDDERLRFSARVTVIPSYGRPGGPTLESSPEVPASTAESQLDARRAASLERRSH